MTKKHAASGKYRLTREEGIGRPGDPGYIDPGTEVTIRERVPADVPGAHDDTEDSVVIEIPVEYTDDNNQPATTSRAMSVSETNFADWFEPV